MILVDLQHTIISSIMAVRNTGEIAEITPKFMAHVALNCLRTYKKKFDVAYGPEMVLACEGYKSWRREIFPEYKAKRRADKKDDLDWKEVYQVINDIKASLKASFPYKVIEAEHAEADDIIASIVEHVNGMSPIMIVSGDKDFLQLQKYAQVHQYRPVQKNMAISNNPRMDLREMIMTGDVSDGIPNFLSDNDTFVVPSKRQRPLRKERLAQWRIMEDPSLSHDWTEEMRHNYNRNRVLIDFDCIPAPLKSEIITKYLTEQPRGNKRTVYEYLVQNQFRHLLDVADEF